MSSVKKMLSKSAVEKSISPEVQAHAAANIDAIFRNSKRLESKPDRTGDRNIKSIHRYYVPTYFNDEVCAVKLTVKELANAENNKIYPVESIDLKKTPGQSAEANLQTDGQPQYPDAVKSFFETIENVNKSKNAGEKLLVQNTMYKKGRG